MRLNALQGMAAAAAFGSTLITASAARAAVPSAALAPTVDVMVSRTPNSAVTFQTMPNARCALHAAGNRSTMTVYADDDGVVQLHFTPARHGGSTTTVAADCTARGIRTSKAIRLHVVASVPRRIEPRPFLQARPLVPRGVDPRTLTQADFKRLQLPPRPDAVRDPKSYAQWLRAVTSPVRRIGGTTILRSDVIHGPSKVIRASHVAASGVKNGTGTSGNWSGIVENGGTGQFAYWVAGEWLVPSVYTDIADSPAYSSVWDGIDGSGSGDVIQNGTEQDAYSLPFFGSLNFYSAWYEFFPDGGSTTLPNFNVSPGDEIYAVSWLCYDNIGQRYGCYYMQNLTQGEATPVYSELGAQPALFQGNSAEFVLERPTVGGSLHPLPAFNLTPFWWEHVYDSYAGGGRNVCDENYDVISMYNNGDELASGVTTSCDSSYFFWLNYQ